MKLKRIVMTQKEELLEQYSNYLKMRNYSRSTYKSYMSSVRMFWSFCEGRQEDPNFDKSLAVETYLAYRLSVQHLDFSTVNGDYSALQWFYKHILNRAWNTEKLIRPKTVKKLPRYISPEQVSQLVGCANHTKYKIMFLLYYSTGIRLSEGRLLKWEDVMYDEGIIYIKRGKGGKDRIVVLHEELSDLLKSYQQTLPTNQPFVFAGKYYQLPISARSIQWAFVEARRKAGLPEWVTAHALRHSYATSVLQNRTDIHTLKTLLGHKQISTTSRYLHLNTAHFKRTHNTLSHQCLSATLQQTHQDLR